MLRGDKTFPWRFQPGVQNARLDRPLRQWSVDFFEEIGNVATVIDVAGRIKKAADAISDHLHLPLDERRG